MKNRKIIFFELNEVPFRIFDHFADLYPGSSLAKLRTVARPYETYAEDSGILSPWITWPSLHRGVSNDDHEISDFGADLKFVNNDYPPLWDILSKQGIKVGMFGSLHTYPLPSNLTNYSFYVPDTFAAGPECHPEQLEAFQRFNLKMAGMNVRNVGSRFALMEGINFLLAAPSLGLSARTTALLSKQVAQERFKSTRTVRRRTSQMQMAFDFFIKAQKNTKPDVSFFFTNHVASSMHRYWPALFPDDYTNLRFDQTWLDCWEDEIAFTMREAAHQLAKLMSYVDNNPEYNLVVATSMGQEAVQDEDPVESAVVFTAFSKLMSHIGLTKTEWEKRPAMAPRYSVKIAADKKQRVIQNLGALSINGKGIAVKDIGNNVLSLKFRLDNQDHLNVTYQGKSVPSENIGLTNMDLLDAAGSNAYHMPNGMFLIYDPTNPYVKEGVAPERISTLEVAPSVLKNFSLSPHGYMERALDL